MSERQVEDLGNSAIAALQEHQVRLTNGLVATAGATTPPVGGLFVTIFALVCFLHGGRDIYRFVAALFPASIRRGFATRAQPGATRR